MLKLLRIKNEDCVADILRNGCCSMVFQPIVDIRSGGVFSFEALFRGSEGACPLSPERLFSQEGNLSDEELLKLDLACIGSALKKAKPLACRHRIFINICSGTLKELSYNHEAFFKLVDDLGINPKNIVFEISEKTKDGCISSVAENLRTFRESGVQMAIDDVGISLDWLHHMLTVQPSFLKVDKYFIRDMEFDPKKQEVVQYVVGLADRKGLHLVAEGVQSPREMDILARIGVPFMQGFWIGYPLSAEKWICAPEHGVFQCQSVPVPQGMKGMPK